MIQGYNKGKDKKVIVWACFRGNRQKSDLIFMPEDLESKRERVISRIYLRIIEEQLPNLQKKGLIFIQDNAPIYKGDIIKSQLAEKGIIVVEQPSYSPDLNLIKYL